MGRYLSRTSGKTDGQICLPPSPESTTLAQDNPIFDRLKIAAHYMITKGNSVEGPKQFKVKIISKLLNEAMEDMVDADLHPEIMGLYLRQLGGMIDWVATGEWKSEIPIPEGFES